VCRVHHQTGLGEALGSLRARRHGDFGLGRLSAQIGENEFTLTPDSRADYTALVQKLRASNRVPTVIAHCWGVTRRVDPMPDAPALRGYEARGFYSLMFLAQALGESGITSPIRLGIVTDGVQEVTGLETLVPEKSGGLGRARVIRKGVRDDFVPAIDFPISARNSTTPDQSAGRGPMSQGGDRGSPSRKPPLVQCYEVAHRSPRRTSQAVCARAVCTS
jgi:hypothetical protein